MTTDFSKQGRASKRKGSQAELESAKFWSKELETVIRRCPRSGGFSMDFKGDLFDTKNSILKDWVVEVKCGNQIPKKINDWMEKLSDESQLKFHFLELKRPYQEPLITMERKQFAQILADLQAWRKDNKN